MKDCAKTLAGLDAGIAAVREDIDKKKRFGDVTPARMAVLKEDLEAAEVKYREDTTTTIAEARKATESARSALEQDVAEFAAVHPEDMDTNTVALLNAGIVKDFDLVRLANGATPTMLRLICAQAERMMEDSATARSLVAQIRAYLDPAARLSVFDSALLNSHIGAGADLINIVVEVWDNTLYQKFKREMAALENFTFSAQ